MLTLKGNELLLYPNNASREGPYREGPSIRLCVMLKVPRSEFHFNPSQIIILVGVQMDFSSFGIKPALTMSVLTVLDCSLHLERSFSVDQPSSKIRLY